MLIAVFAFCILMYLMADMVPGLHAYREAAATRSDYTKITTPLPRKIVRDLCAKFDIDPSDPRCLPNAIVYGPDFFGDIKSYLEQLPQQDQTLVTIQNKLGPYLISCGEPDGKGRYVCTYDLRGDGIYGINVFFTKDNSYYRIIADTSGS